MQCCSLAERAASTASILVARSIGKPRYAAICSARRTSGHCCVTTGRVWGWQWCWRSRDQLSCEPHGQRRHHARPIAHWCVHALCEADCRTKSLDAEFGELIFPDDVGLDEDAWEIMMFPGSGVLRGDVVCNLRFGERVATMQSSWSNECQRSSSESDESR